MWQHSKIDSCQNYSKVYIIVVVRNEVPVMNCDQHAPVLTALIQQQETTDKESKVNTRMWPGTGEPSLSSHGFQV